MRGKAAALNHAGVESGITPAYAGKRILGATGNTRLKDHSRLCGEKKNPKKSWSKI